MKHCMFFVAGLILLCTAVESQPEGIANVPETATKFGIRADDGSEYSNVHIKGQINTSISWTDETGKSLLLLTETGAHAKPETEEKTAELFAFHFKIDNGNASLIRRVYDFEKDCPFDIYLGFLDSSLTITDLDEDGIAEITFLYKLSCRSDITPSRMKLIMLENNVKYALRGKMINDFVKQLPDEQRSKLIDEFGWGKFAVDPAFDQAPKIFLEFAIRRWESYKDNDLFLQMDLE